MKKQILLLSALALAFSSAVHCESTDLVIIGAGGGGMSAAIEAHNQGAKVILLEKMPFAGGNTARAEGGLNAAGTEYQKAKGIDDSPELFYQDTMKGGKQKNNPELVKTLAEHAKDSILFLKENGAELSDVTRAGGASVDRIHRPMGGEPAGSFIAVALLKKVKALNIDLRTNTSATEILQDDKGAVTGVKAKGKDGKEFTIDAKKVMITAGGFGANFDMIGEYDPKLVDFKTTNAPGAQGEGIKMAQKLNAKLVDMEYIQIHPTTVPGQGILISEGVRGDGAILVNEQGKRFTNELLTRDVVSQSILKQPGKHAYVIFNDALAKQNHTIETYFKQKLVAEGNTVEELAKAINVDGKQLTQTLSAYSGYVKDKKDAEFGRDSLKLPLDSGKYYAIEVTPGIHHTMGGIAINTKAQVLDVNGKVIPNLFAAGEVAGGVHGANRLGGNSLADIVTYGRIGADEAVKELKAGK
ncbi:flavocytochrome c [Brenneria goodwinii]|uniref:flavocytochrome c n=1 Tax=Brenneria goodwinii TaxID=1109412 RepID=UPI000EF24B80|nr:flavocytochrome c [Brenneria goodwinii]MCG8154857.1 flavocytochrome c [Brenneria goodwinii]MCG8159806.1 flavocytochrome c [Brenneria goodwinii]MCG8164095.1 flavocytochrome c [Brenneria goodwinii]MCG8168704.1 flavocytochrome c [Brenneria goodwinii]MCG8173741.1 flavocytochrome c [Brenneria goodwinii]